MSEARVLSAPLAQIQATGTRLDARPLKFLAISYLADTFGDQNLIRYFENLSTGRNTETALDHAFGLSLEEFHTNFESYRQIVAPPLSSETARIIFLGEDALEQAEDIRRIVSAVEQWFEEQFAYPAASAVWRVDSQGSHCGLAAPTTIDIGSRCLLAPGVYAHEYFHRLQNERSVPDSLQALRTYPPFMLEGSATFIGNVYLASVSGTEWSETRAGIVAAASRRTIALDDPTLRIQPGSPEYSLGALATEWLEGRSGKSVADYYHALSQHDPRPEDGDHQYERAGERAFQEFWGISTDEFYRQFACWRERGFPLAEVGEECAPTDSTPAS